MSGPGKILLVDDDPGIVDTLSRVLTDEGYEVAVENRGDAGFTRAASESFNSVLRS